MEAPKINIKLNWELGSLTLFNLPVMTVGEGIERPEATVQESIDILIDAICQLKYLQTALDKNASDDQESQDALIAEYHESEEYYAAKTNNYEQSTKI